MTGLSFEAFLRQRGFDPEDRPGFWKRMFVTCWGEPGFHRFWRLWNPLYGYGLFRLYLFLGGRDRPALASLVVFLACGFFLHDLLMVAVTHHVAFTVTIAFGIFWALSVLNRKLAPRIHQERWPRPINAACNSLCILVGLSVSGLVQRHL